MATFPPPELKEVASSIAALLNERKETVCVAETAAGGLISASLLSCRGASRFYKGGLTLYTLDSRVAFADYTQEDIDGYKGPTPQGVANFTTSVKHKLNATYAVGESGMAGPTGREGADNLKPGYVALAVVSEHKTETRDLNTGTGDRERNMLLFALEALKLLKEQIEAQASSKI